MNAGMFKCTIIPYENFKQYFMLLTKKNASTCTSKLSNTCCIYPEYQITLNFSHKLNKYNCLVSTYLVKLNESKHELKTSLTLKRRPT